MLETIDRLSEEISESKDISKVNTESNKSTQKTTSHKTSKTSKSEKEEENINNKNLNETKCLIIKCPSQDKNTFSPNNISFLQNLLIYNKILTLNIHSFLYGFTLNNHEYNLMFFSKNNINNTQYYRIFNSNKNILFIKKKTEGYIFEYILYYIIFILGKYFIYFSLIIKSNNENPLIIYNIMKCILDVYFHLNSIIPNYFNNFSFKAGFIIDPNNNNYYYFQIIIYFQLNIFRNVINGYERYKLIEGNKKYNGNYLYEEKSSLLIDEYENKIIVENTKDNIFYEEYNKFYDSL